jgi:hypothetical protein
MRGYKALDWSGPSELTREEQELVEIMRRDLWRHGIRKRPQLDAMAFEFAWAATSANAAARAKKEM